MPSALLLASDGIVDGEGAAAALALGTDGVWVGTRLVITPDAAVHSKHKPRLVEGKAMNERQVRSPPSGLGQMVERAESFIPVRGLACSRWSSAFRRYIPFLDRHTLERRHPAYGPQFQTCTITCIQIAYWTERGQSGDIDKGIISGTHTGLSSNGYGCSSGFEETWSVVTPGYRVGHESSHNIYPHRRGEEERFAGVVTTIGIQ